MQDFTSDPGALQRALVRGKDYVQTVSIFSHSHKWRRADMDTHTMNAMQMISDRLVKLPGRKNLILAFDRISCG